MLHTVAGSRPAAAPICHTELLWSLPLGEETPEVHVGFSLPRPEAGRSFLLVFHWPEPVTERGRPVAPGTCRLVGRVGGPIPLPPGDSGISRLLLCLFPQVQQSSFYGYTGMLPKRYTQGVMTGESECLQPPGGSPQRGADQAGAGAGAGQVQGRGRPCQGWGRCRVGGRPCQGWGRCRTGGRPGRGWGRAEDAEWGLRCRPSRPPSPLQARRVSWCP